MKNIILITILASLASCATYMKKKECEKSNWFEQGERVALSGNWLKSDEFVASCRKAEAEISETQLDQGFKSGREKYCHIENVKMLGRKGKNFSKALCDGPGLSSAMKSYQQGVAHYCTAANGLIVGQSGETYTQVCPQDLEPSFMVEYKKGRLSFLQERIHVEESELTKLQAQIETQKVRISNLQTQESSLDAQITNNNTLLALTNEKTPSALIVNLNGQASQLQTQKERLIRERQEATRERDKLDKNIQKVEESLTFLKSELSKLK